MGHGRPITQSQRRFAQIPDVQIPRSSFDRSCGIKTTFDSGLLIPFFVDEALPGDTFNMQANLFGRLATPLRPFMDNLWLDTFFFAVPVRLIWDNWQKFNGEQLKPGDSTDFQVPEITARAGGEPELSLSDYLGIPTKIDGLKFNALWHRAYNLVFAEWFRDQNLTDPPVLNTDDGPDDPADYQVLRRAKRHDYFSSCLPWPQKGPAVELPLGPSAPVTISSSGDGEPVWNVGGDAVSLKSEIGQNAVWTADPTGISNASWNDPKLAGTADLSAATAATINSIREAFQFQRMYEKDARGGTRYTEQIRVHFGVVSPDQRLQRPEYLGGSSHPINVNPVANTAGPGVGSFTGDLGAFGTLGGRAGFVKSFVEHCVIIGLVNVRADLNYQQGLDRMFSRRTRFDYFWPTLAHLGEQAVLNQEIFADGTAADGDVFGYQERYAEYRYKPSRVTGQFRSNAATPLDIWHLALDFETRPVLNNSFIEDNPPVSRVVQVPAEPEILLDAFFKYRCARPMPVYSVPGLIDHF